MSIIYSQQDILPIILENGADVNLPMLYLGYPVAEGEYLLVTPLFLAFHSDNEIAAKLIMERGATLGERKTNKRKYPGGKYDELFDQFEKKIAQIKQQKLQKLEDQLVALQEKYAVLKTHSSSISSSFETNYDSTTTDSKKLIPSFDFTIDTDQQQKFTTLLNLILKNIIELAKKGDLLNVFAAMRDYFDKNYNIKNPSRVFNQVLIEMVYKLFDYLKYENKQESKLCLNNCIEIVETYIKKTTESIAYFQSQTDTQSEEIQENQVTLAAPGI